MLVEDYANAVEIITSKEFNPNETNKVWGSPILAAMIDIMAYELDKIYSMFPELEDTPEIEKEAGEVK